jgi:hypothetical protein
MVALLNITADVIAEPSPTLEAAMTAIERFAKELEAAVREQMPPPPPIH